MILKKIINKSLNFKILIILFIVLSGFSLETSFAYSPSMMFYKDQITILNSDSAKNKTKIQKETVRQIMSDLFSGYIQLKNSLSKNDSVTAQTQALQFLDKIENSTDNLQKSDIPVNWKKFMKYAPESRSLISSSTSIAQQRYFFRMLSEYIIKFLKLYGMKNKTVYILQCGRNGKWLSDFNDGKNPYLGPGNENCIEVLESKMY